MRRIVNQIGYNLLKSVSVGRPGYLKSVSKVTSSSWKSVNLKGTISSKLVVSVYNLQWNYVQLSQDYCSTYAGITNKLFSATFCLLFSFQMRCEPLLDSITGGFSFYTIYPGGTFYRTTGIACGFLTLLKYFNTPPKKLYVHTVTMSMLYRLKRVITKRIAVTVKSLF